MWFGWAQQGPPAGWSVPLTVGAVLGLLVAMIAAVLTWRHRNGGSAMGDLRGRRTHLRVVGAEVAAIAVGAAALGISGRSAYLAAWILFVVGAHFVPLGRLFRITGLVVAGVVLVVVSAAAAVVGVVGTALPSAVAGAGGGLVMVISGALSLQQSWRPANSPHSRSAA
jgi:hypothetical protein